jgi:hypothetical protein
MGPVPPEMTKLYGVVSTDSEKHVHSMPTSWKNMMGDNLRLAVAAKRDAGDDIIIWIR